MSHQPVRSQGKELNIFISPFFAVKSTENQFIGVQMRAHYWVLQSEKSEQTEQRRRNSCCCV